MVYCLFEQSGTFKNEFKKLVLVAKRRNLKLILENPYTSQHFLKLYWALKPTIIDNDRRLGGDYFKKPTQYWFVNCEPTNNFIFGRTKDNGINRQIKFLKKEHIDKMNADSVKTARSMIHPEYANRFIRQYIL